MAITEPLIDKKSKEFRKIYLALRFPEHDVFMPEAHLTLKYYSRVQLSKLANDYNELTKYVPTQLHIPRMEYWTGGDKRYKGLVFDKDDNPALFQFVNMPHITMKKQLKPDVIKYLTWDAEFIADRIVIGSKKSDVVRYDTLDEFLEEYDV